MTAHVIFWLEVLYGTICGISLYGTIRYVINRKRGNCAGGISDYAWGIFVLLMIAITGVLAYIV